MNEELDSLLSEKVSNFLPTWKVNSFVHVILSQKGNVSARTSKWNLHPQPAYQFWDCTLLDRCKSLFRCNVRLLFFICRFIGIYGHTLLKHATHVSSINLLALYKGAFIIYNLGRVEELQGGSHFWTVNLGGGGINDTCYASAENSRNQQLLDYRHINII